MRQGVVKDGVFFAEGLGHCPAGFYSCLEVSNSVDHNARQIDKQEMV